MNDKGLKILLIEDNAGDVRLIREMLAEVEGMSYNLETAGRLSAGLECLAKQQFDVVLLDLGLPDSQGLETLNKMYTRTPTTPIVVLTGLGDEATANQAVREGAQDYLLKGDINGRALWRVIRYAIERKRAEEALRQSEEKYRSLVETASAGVASIDLEGNLTFVNQSLLEQLGYSEKEIIGKNFAGFIHPEDGERVLNIFMEGVANPDLKPKLEFCLMDKDGHSICYYTAPTPVIISGVLSGASAILINITERKQAEEALQQSEEKHRVLFETMAQGVVYQSADGKIFSANPAAERILGLTLDQMQGRTSMDPRWKAIHEDGSDFPGETHPSIIALKTGKEVKDVVMGVFNPGDEQYHWISIYATPQFRPGESKPYRVYTTFADITERKQAEEALLEAKEFSESLITSARDGISVLDNSGVHIDVNPTLCEMTGFLREELIGVGLPHPYWPPEQYEEIDRAFQKTVIGDFANVELTFMRKNGERFPVIVSPAWIRDKHGNVISYFATVKDITERKRLEEHLASERQQLKLIIDASPILVFYKDNEGRFVRVNKAMIESLAKREEEVVGKTVFDLFSAGIAQSMTNDDQEVLKSGCPKLNIIEQYKSASGIRWVQTDKVPIFDQSGTISGLIGFAQDVTERKRAEEERRQLEQKAELASRLASIGEMASGIAHEINNPLTGVIGYAQLLSKKELPEDIREGLEVINDGAQRVAGIIKRLLTFARQYKPERTLVNINNIIETTINLRSYHLKTNNIKLTTRLAPDLPTTIADAGQLQQVFLNLIVNAETEMKQAHGKGKLSVRTEQMDNIIRISFKDDGPGIMKKNIERIFNPFFTTRKVGEGTGLGLSVCHGIIAEHGGRIYAESKLGKGATFIIELPIITADEQMELPELIAEEPQKVTNARILVVDDEPGVRQFLEQALTDEGHEVQTVDNASDALERIKSQRYSLILLDIKMPDMSGIELYERIHKIARSLAGRVVFITGDVLGINTAAFLSKTKAPHIIKPFDSEQLKKDIRLILTEGARGWARRQG